MENKRVTFFADDLSRIDYIKSTIERIFSNLNSKFNWREFNRLGIRSLWIEQISELDFNTFVKKYKKGLLNENSEIVKPSVDVGIVLTLKDGQNLINFISGPMEKSQLMKQYFGGQNLEVPERFLFVDIDYPLINAQYNSRLVKTSVEQALSYAAQKADLLKECYINPNV